MAVTIGGRINKEAVSGKAINYSTNSGNLTTIISDRNYVHTQMSASSVWTITHNLGKYCSITVTDSAGDEVFGGNVHYDSLNQVTITFTSAFAGKAYCN